MLKRLTAFFLTLFFGILAFSIALGVYFITASKYVQPGDSTEMVTAAVSLGIPHQPGYPLNTLIGHLFYQANIFGLDGIHKINLASSFLQALTVFVFYFLMVEVFIPLRQGFEGQGEIGGIGEFRDIREIRKVGGVRDIISAFTAAMFLAFNLIFWQYATKFEVFPLNNLLVVTILLVAFRLANQIRDFREIREFGYKEKAHWIKQDLIPIGKSATSNGAGGRTRDKTKVVMVCLILMSFLLGLAVTHHQTAVLIFPALLIILWLVMKSALQGGTLQGRILGNSGKLGTLGKMGILFLAFLIGFSVYFILILKFSSLNPQMNGGIKNFGDEVSTLSRSEYGLFSAYLKTENTVKTSYPLDQMIFYLRSILYDYSIYGVAFILLGIFILLKNNRRLLAIILTGVFFSGFLFLAYADFPLSDAFNQATARRFQMLPDIFVSMLAGIGIFALVSYLGSLSGNKRGTRETGGMRQMRHMGLMGIYRRLKEFRGMVKEYRGERETEEYKVRLKEFRGNIGDYNSTNSLHDNGGMLAVYAVTIGISMLPIYFNFKKANIRDDDLTQNFINNSYGSVPDGSLVMVSGDVQNMTGEFYRISQNPSTKTKIFTPGRFYLPWYVDDLLNAYNDLEIPPPVSGKMFTTVSQVVEANYGKHPIYISPDLLAKDPEIQKVYTLYPKNLLYEVKKKGEDIKLEDWRDENKRLYDSLDMDKIAKMRGRSPGFEEMIVYYYARHFYNSGYVFSEVKLYDNAITEYQRSIYLEPSFVESYLGMSEAFANKEEPDYASAINYLAQYQRMIYPYDQNKAYDAQKTLEEYQKKYGEVYKQELERQKLEASGSAEVNISSESGKQVN